MSLVSVKDLSFSYKRKQEVLSKINLNIKAQTVYGFLGANGAGKTTTLRLILGLLKPTSGQINLFGKNISKSFPKDLSRVGSLIESPSSYMHLNARQNLKIWAHYFKAPKTQIDRVLELVKLNETGNKNISDFSTGMKQRLSLASALLTDPELLILDEPTNGLDPMGIIELRKVISELKASGKTIIISSHILSEVEKIVDTIGVIKDGRMLFEGQIEELQKLKEKNIKIKVVVSDAQEFVNIINPESYELINQKEVHIKLKENQKVPSIIRTAVEHNLDLNSVTPLTGNLEDLFLNLTS